jgi:hypothetical protein
LDQRHGVVIRRISQEHHAVLVPVRELESHDIGPKLCAAFDIADTQHNMTDFFYRDWRFFVRHKRAPLLFERGGSPARK